MSQDTGRVTHWLAVDHGRLKRAESAAAQVLPADWMPFVEKEVGQALGKRMGRYRQWFENPIDGADVYRKWGSEFGGAAAADLSDSEIKALALQFAEDAQALDIGHTTHGAGDDWVAFKNGAWGELVRLIGFCEARSVHAPDVGFKLAGMAARVRCKYWWRRQLRKMVARLYERGAIGLGMVSQRSGQSYASNKAVFRRLDQNKRNAQALEATALENEDGQRATLAELAARSVSNKAIRRGELMTRIRGCEEIADELGMPGVFLTLTCPSRFHAIKHTGKRNKKHDGSQPNEGQQWLCKMWARARAKLKREGLNVFGFRVAEPHHDACPHWHALFWAADGAAIDRACEVIREYWLSEDGEEQGASEHRVKAKRMDKGGAAGYIAKYIAKNILISYLPQTEQ
jgi:hypothetical protein